VFETAYFYPDLAVLSRNCKVSQEAARYLYDSAATSQKGLVYSCNRIGRDVRSSLPEDMTRSMKPVS
jgi:uncharacterized protein YfaT (DUF1175 family)